MLLVLKFKKEAVFCINGLQTIQAILSAWVCNDTGMPGLDNDIPLLII
jgi:hypothetical protein